MTPAAALALVALATPPDIPPPGADIPPAPLDIPVAPSAREKPPDIVVAATHSLALEVVMRAGESYLWPQPFSQPKYFGEHYKDSFTKWPLFDPHAKAFEWDGDDWKINTIGHGVFGSELYMRARQCRFGVIGSLAFAAATSALWEFGFEGNGVQPSVEDLVWTPLAGALLGEGRYFVYHHTTSTVVHVIMDPFGEIERAAGAGC